MSSDSHQVTSLGHDITQESQVSVVDIRAIEWNDVEHFLLNRLPHRLHSQYLKKHQAAAANLKRHLYNLHKLLVSNSGYNFVALA